MARPFKTNYEKRAIFPVLKQREFLLRVAENLEISWNSLAQKIGVHKRTLYDWRREKYSISLASLEKMCELSGTTLPENIEIREPFWSVKIAAQKAGKVTYNRYGKIGNPDVRRKKWREWWEKKGKNNPNSWFVQKPIFCPEKNEKLAEFVGIMMGDGSITERQITITLNSITDKDYCLYVKGLIKELFMIEAKIGSRKNESTIILRVSRTSLVNYCKSIGLLVGNKIKQNLDIPDWVKKNKKFTICCIRGLVDTDGCIFIERHNIKGKKYCYPRLSFVSASPNLRNSVYNALKTLGISSIERGNRSIQVENYNQIKRYFDKIGTSNPKHEHKFKKSFGGVG